MLTDDGRAAEHCEVNQEHQREIYVVWLRKTSAGPAPVA